MEVGIHYATILPFLGALVTAYGLARAVQGSSGATRALAAGLGIIVAGWLVYMIPFVRLDYTLAEVARNANSDLPFMIRLATSWSGGGGSLYLYTTMISASLLAVLVPLARKGEVAPRSFLIASGAVVLAAFASALLNGAFDVNPEGVGGLGLNPLLKNLWIVPHPLTTFGGYALLLAGALMAVYAGNTVRGLGVFVLGWGLLTLGIMFGAIWSYETFGWGGYWAWDPVEISELSVWLMATAALHMLGPLSPLRKGFLLSAASTALFAPFVTRSGLSPLHSFAAADIGSAILLVAGVVVLGLAIHDISGKIGRVRISLKPKTGAELANTSIGLAGASLAAIAFFVYASLLVPGVLNVLGREATVPTMRQGIEFYHPVLLPLFLFSLVWLPGYFLARRVGVKGFTALILTELVISAVLVAAVRSGTIDLLPGAPEPTKMQVAASLPVAGITLAALLIGLAEPLVPGIRRKTSLRDAGLKVLHAGMLIAFIGVLMSGTYAFNDRFFQTYTIYPDRMTDAGILALGIEDYRYTVYSGTIDLRSHLSPNALTAAGAWAGLSMLRQDIGVAVQEVEFARQEIASNRTLQGLTDIVVNKTIFSLGNLTLAGNATVSATNVTTRTTTVLANNETISLHALNATLIITVTPVTDQAGGLAGAWIVSGMQASEIAITGVDAAGVSISFHSPLEINFTSPVTIDIADNTSLAIESLRVYPGGNASQTIIEPNKTRVTQAFVEIANATLLLPSGTIRIPVPTGPGFYLLVSLIQGSIPELRAILECKPLVETLTNTTLMMTIVGQRTGELPYLPSDAPSGLALDLVIRAVIGGEERTVNTRIRFEANGEAMGIHGLVTPAVLFREGLGDIYVSVHPPMASSLDQDYHEPLVRYIRHAIEMLPPGEALTLTAVMASGYNINTLSSTDLNHAGFIVERSVASLYVAAYNSTDAVAENGIVVMVKYVPGVNLVWAGTTLMAISGFILGALYLRASLRRGG